MRNDPNRWPRIGAKVAIRAGDAVWVAGRFVTLESDHPWIGRTPGEIGAEVRRSPWEIEDEARRHVTSPILRIKPTADRPADLAWPTYATPGAAGLDLPSMEAVTLAPGERRLVRTGLEVDVPAGYEAQIRPRSGLAARHGVTVLNAPGTIDSDYRGEVRVLLVNLGAEPHTIEVGDRIAQMVVAPVVRVTTALVAVLDPTERGAGGFGHTGR